MTIHIIQTPDFPLNVPHLHPQAPLFSVSLELAFSEREGSQLVPDLLDAGPINRVGGSWQQQIDVREEDVHELWDSVTTEVVCEVEETRHIEGQNDTDVGTTCPKALAWASQVGSRSTVWAMRP